MADFPNSIPTFRTIQNKPGQTYDPDKRTTLFTEDVQQIRDEVTAIDTAFEGSGHVFDDDVTVTEFFGTAVDLGTGGSCRVDAVTQWQMIYLRIQIVFGEDLDLGTQPISIKGADLPITIPDYGVQNAFPGNFGALSKADGTVQMFAPTINNVAGFGQCIIFFNQGAGVYLDFLAGPSNPIPPLAGDIYWATIIAPVIEY